ncbi:MAG: acyltransferase family protein [Paludibacter sp.]
MNKYKNISFFEGLNSLRFFAAFLVVMHHSETIREKNGLYNFEWLGLFRNGTNAVVFFFVLSGFLITYLLLKESHKTGTVSIKHFYVKRMLRIWPLYFLLVIIGTLLVPVVFNLLHINYVMPYNFRQTWYYFLFFLPGLVAFYFGHHLLEPLWSIGIEEVFYLIWAPLFKIGKKKILPILLFIIAIKIFLLVLAEFWIKNALFVYVVNIFRFEAMAIGGLGAYFIFHRKEVLSNMLIYKKPIQLIIYTTLIAYLIFQGNVHNIVWKTLFETPILSGILLDFLFLYLIIGVSLIENNIFKFRQKFLSYLGEISYGIYMYQLLIIFAVIQFLKKYLIQLSPAVSTLLFYSIVIIAIIAVASVSKVVFENYFLNLKKKVDKSPLK